MTKQYRVAVLFDNFGPYHLARLGAASQVVDLLAVEFATSSHEYIWERAESASSLQKTALTSSGSSEQFSTAIFRSRLHQVLNDFAPNAVAIPGWSGRGAFIAMQWCLQNKVPAIVMSESTAHDEARSIWREWVKRRYVALCSTALVGGRPHEDYMRQLGMARERIFQGYDAVGNRYFADKAAECRVIHDACRKQYDLPKNYFLASARFIEKKNLARLIEAYARYRKHSEKPEVWDLVLLGDGELRSALESQVCGLNLQNSVHLPGFKQYPELPIYYGLAGAFIHASTTEQWGLVVNEAMASGLPILVSNRCGCVPDLVEEGVNGHTFDPTNVEQLADLMLQVSSFSLQVSSNFASASQRIISQWGPERFAEGLKSATEAALKIATRRARWMDRLLLFALSRR